MYWASVILLREISLKLINESGKSAVVLATALDQRRGDIRTAYSFADVAQQPVAGAVLGLASVVPAGCRPARESEVQGACLQPT